MDGEWQREDLCQQWEGNLVAEVLLVSLQAASSSSADVWIWISYLHYVRRTWLLHFDSIDHARSSTNHHTHPERRLELWTRRQTRSRGHAGWWGGGHEHRLEFTTSHVSWVQFLCAPGKWDESGSSPASRWCTSQWDPRWRRRGHQRGRWSRLSSSLLLADTWRDATLGSCIGLGSMPLERSQHSATTWDAFFRK